MNAINALGAAGNNGNFAKIALLPAKVPAPDCRMGSGNNGNNVFSIVPVFPRPLRRRNSQGQT